MRLRVLAPLLVAGCFPEVRTPGMTPFTPRPHDATTDEVARVEPGVDRRPLLVVYPRTACSGSASTVILDDEGVFVGAIPPGGAALLVIPASAKTLTTMSSVEVTAAVSSWTFSQTVDVPDLPSGLLLQPARFTTRECGNGQYAEAKAATKAELEAALADREIRWLEPRVEEGQVWIEAHRERVDEVLGVNQTGVPDVVARLERRRRR
jgi:hypothetical protein